MLPQAVPRSVRDMTMAPTNRKAMANRKMHKARAKALRENRRPKASVSSLPRMSERTEKNSMATVVIFTPPAVPAGAPPMNISRKLSSLLPSHRAVWSMVLKPAVRQVTDWNREAINWVDSGNSPRVSGLCRSNSQKRIPPPKTSIAVAINTVRP